MTEDAAQKLRFTMPACAVTNISVEWKFDKGIAVIPFAKRFQALRNFRTVSFTWSEGFMSFLSVRHPAKRVALGQQFIVGAPSSQLSMFE